MVARGEQRERAQLLGRALVREPLPDLRRDDVRVDRLLEAAGEGEGEGEGEGYARVKPARVKPARVKP